MTTKKKAGKPLRSPAQDDAQQTTTTHSAASGETREQARADRKRKRKIERAMQGIEDADAPDGALTSPPAWLADRRVWLIWALEPNPEGTRPKKMPYYAATNVRRHGELGGEDDLAQLVTYDEALDHARRHGKEPALAIVDDLAFIDLDDCLRDGEPTEFARGIADACPDALVEVSQSCQGLHILGVTGARLRVSANRKASGFEAYTYGRFCAWTGNVINGGEAPSDLDPVLGHLLSIADEAPRDDAAPFVEPSPRAKALYDDSPEAARELLERIPNDEAEWSVYNQVMCALKNTLPGDDGLELFLGWASKAEKFEERTSRAEWRGWKPKKAGKKFTLATLVYLATRQDDAVKGRKPKGAAAFWPTQEDEAPSGLSIVTFADAHERTKDAPLRWAIKNLLPVGGALLTVGSAKVGKSMVAYEINSLATSGGGDLFALPDYPVAPTQVLHISLEDGERRAAARFHALHGKRRTEFEPLLVTEWPRGLNAVDALNNALDKYKDVGLVIIDTLLALNLKEGEDLETAKQKSRGVTQDQYNLGVRFNELAQQRGIAIKLIHHAKKGASREADIMDRVNGTMGLNAAFDSVVTFTRIPHEKMTLAAFDSVNRDAEFNLNCALEMREAGRWYYFGTVEEAKATTGQRTLLDTVAQLQTTSKDPEGWVSSLDVAEALGKPRESVVRALQRLADKALLDSHHGKGFRMAKPSSKF